EQAETHRFVAGGVVTRLPHRAERPAGFAGDHGVGGRARGTGGAQRGFQRTGRHHGVGIQLHLALRRRTREDVVHVFGAVDVLELFTGRARRFRALDRRKPWIIQSLQHCAQPSRGFGVTDAGIVFETGGMGVEAHAGPDASAVRGSWKNRMDWLAPSGPPQPAPAPAWGHSLAILPIRSGSGRKAGGHGNDKLFCRKPAAVASSLRWARTFFVLPQYLAVATG